MNRQERRLKRKQQQKSNAGSAASDSATQALLDAAAEHYAAGRLDKAAELCQDAIGTAPLDGEPYHLYALVCYRQGRLQDAGEKILEAATRNETNPELHANCGAIMNMLGRHAEAEAACRHVIDLSPRSAEAYCNLGVALEMQSRITEAFEACQMALDLEPDYLEARINLGNLYVRTGDYLSGLESFAGAIEQAPDNPAARANLSVALLRLGEVDEACDQAREALGLNPEYVEAFIALGNGLTSARKFAEAEDCYRSALEIHPNHAEAGIGLAVTLHKAGRSRAAVTVYRDLLKAHPELPETEAGLGLLLLTCGQYDEALALLRSAINSKPMLGEAQYNLAMAAGAALTSDEISAMHKQLGSDNLLPFDRIFLHFGLAEAADKKSDPKTAFHHFQTGNTLRRDIYTKNEITFDSDEFNQFIDEIISVFTPEMLSRLGGQGKASEAPVFIVGMPRSGTTLVEQIAASHPAVKATGERDLISSAFENYPSEVSHIAPEHVQKLTNQLWSEMTSANDKSHRIIERTPFNFLALGLIQILFPNARIVHCKRDSMDLGLSCYAQNFVTEQPWSTDLNHIATVIQGEARLSAHWGKTLTLPILDVQYENLITNQEKETRRIMDFLGLEYDPACLRFYDHEQTVLSIANWCVRKPVYSSSKGRAGAYEDYLEALRGGLS